MPPASPTPAPLAPFNIKKRGLKKLQVRLYHLHKLLHAIHAMPKNRRVPCNSRRFYTPTETAAD